MLVEVFGVVGTLDGRVALVTGGGTGIGASISARLAAEGALVAIGQRTVAEIEQAMAAGLGAAAGLAVDISTREGCRTLVADVVERFGRIDILVNNAAVTGPPAVGSFAEFDDDRLDLLIDVNLKAPFRCAREALPHMAAGSVVINIASVAAYAAQVDAAAYVMSKAGLVGLTRALGFELAPRGIRVVHVSPGDIMTGPGPDVSADDQPWARRTPLGRRGRPEDVSAAVAWLCSSDASFITGSGVVVDGGWISY